MLYRIARWKRIAARGEIPAPECWHPLNRTNILKVFRFPDHGGMPKRIQPNWPRNCLSSQVRTLPTCWAEWLLSVENLSFTFPVGDLSCPAFWISTTAKAVRTFRVRPNPLPNTPHDQIHCKGSFVATGFHPNQRSFFLLDPKVWNATSTSVAPIQVEQLQLHQNTCLQTFAPGDAISTHRFLLQVSKVSARKNKNSNPRSTIA